MKRGITSIFALAAVAGIVYLLTRPKTASAATLPAETTGPVVTTKPRVPAGTTTTAKTTSAAD